MLGRGYWPAMLRETMIATATAGRTAVSVGSVTPSVPDQVHRLTRQDGAHDRESASDPDRSGDLARLREFRRQPRSRGLDVTGHRVSRFSTYGWTIRTVIDN